TNENTNGLVRDFLPKGSDFSTLTDKRVQKIQDLLNGRPRKALNWYTPEEKIQELFK
ncbi:transposase, partial [Corynebacterium minutissimum]|nr:IS30 family transposase [Corynebacterium minutissimum]MCG7239010.1 IS30 family transposase [Corynebacterium minutissimum]